jgi:hypothetical protein
VDNLIEEPKKKIQLLIKQVLEKKKKETREPFGAKMAEVFASQAKFLRAEGVVQLELLVCCFFQGQIFL